jgi:hypothetical protein
MGIIRNKILNKFKNPFEFKISSYTLLYFGVSLFIIILWVYIYFANKSNPSAAIGTFFNSIWSPTHFHIFNFLIDSFLVILLVVLLPGIIIIQISICLFIIFLIYILAMLCTIGVINLFLSLKLSAGKI